MSNNSNVGHALASVMNEVLKLHDVGEISTKHAKGLIAFSVEVADSFDTDVSLVAEFMQDRCSVCLRKCSEDDLIGWSPETKYSDGDPRAKWVQHAFNNCFGEEMVASHVCLDCVKRLPADGPAE